MKKVKNKISFIYNIVLLGFDLKSKLILLANSIIILSEKIIRIKPANFSVWIGDNKQKTKVNFTGTLDELHALTEIFIDKCYKPEKIPNTIIDMGANIGLATIWLKLNYPNTKIHAYEPNPEIFNVLKSNISNLNNVYLYNLAISDTDNEKIEFNISKRSFSSSKFPIPNSNKIYVSATTIDNAINIVNEKVDLIKIDIEGAEFSAIKISNKINEVNEIIGEIHPEKANESSANIINKLEFSHKIKYIGTNKSLFHAIKK